MKKLSLPLIAFASQSFFLSGADGASHFYCESYTPPAYQLACDIGVSLQGEFLYWYAKETKLSYASLAQSEVVGFDNRDIPESTINRKKIFELGVDWNPGFRVGLGVNSACDGWDYLINWTSYRATRSDSASVPSFTDEIISGNGAFVLQNLWERNVSIGEYFSSQGAQILPMLYDRIRADWKFRFNRVGMELGRRYYARPCFTLRPSIGISAIWTRTTFESLASATVDCVSGFSPEPAINTKSIRDHFRNRYWGFGLSTGLDLNWLVCWGFGVRGGFNADLVWGEFLMDKEENYLINRDYTELDELQTYYQSNHSYDNNVYGMQSLFDLKLGLNWESSFCCDRFNFSAFAGWEHEILLHHNARPRWINQEPVLFSTPSGPMTLVGISRYSEEKGSVSFGGFVFELELDF